MITKSIRSELIKVLKTLNISDVEPTLEFPAEITHGDLATNLAFVCAKQVGVTPREFSEKIVNNLSAISGVEKVDIAGPGFINFHFSQTYFHEIMNSVDEDWGKNTALQDKKVLVEKSAPNLFKPFHIGHLLNISVGESLSRLNRFSGAQVIDVAYPSDISLGVAKAVWSILKHNQEDSMTIETLGQAYVDGTKQYKENEQIKAEIDVINVLLNKKEKSDAWRVYEKGRELNLRYFEDITKRLGSEFSDIFFESQSGIVGKDIVLTHTPEIFTESEGAVIFEGEKYGLHTRVFVTSKNLPVYESKDIGLLSLKFDKYNPDLSIVITDVEQKQYFEVIKKAASLINKRWGENSLYWQHGRLRFEGGKISSRYGNVPLAEDLIDQIKEIVADKKPESDPDTVEQIAQAALKYAFLKNSSGKNIVFDFEKSISLEGDSGTYLLYSYVRATSLLEKSSKQEVVAKGVPKNISALEHLLVRFPAVVSRAASEYEPHYVANYLTDLASVFNGWYASERIIGSFEEAYKLKVVSAFAQTMKNGLWLLGINVVNRM